MKIRLLFKKKFNYIKIIYKKSKIKSYLGVNCNKLFNFRNKFSKSLA